LTSLKLKYNQVLILVALFSFSIFSTSLNTLPIDTYAQTSAVINNTTTISPPQANLSLQEEEEQLKMSSLNNTSNSITSSSQQESQIIESPLSLPGLPSVKDIIVKGVYTNNQSGIQVTFPQGWSGTETSQGNNVSLYLHPPTSSSSDILSGGLPSIVLQISHVGSKMPGLNISSKDILNPNDSDLSKKMGCKFTTISSEDVSINQTAGKELTFQCTPSMMANGKVFAINKGENQIIIAYSSLSAETFEKYLPEFDRAVQSLKIQ
jgi:hypothetical protein